MPADHTHTSEDDSAQAQHGDSHRSAEPSFVLSALYEPPRAASADGSAHAQGGQSTSKHDIELNTEGYDDTKPPHLTGPPSSHALAFPRTRNGGRRTPYTATGTSRPSTSRFSSQLDPSQTYIIALLESRGVQREVGIAAMNEATGERLRYDGGNHTADSPLLLQASASSHRCAFSQLLCMLWY